MTVTENVPTSTRLTPEQAERVEKNLPLIKWVISRYFSRTPEDEFEDKYADGVFGLMRAAQLYDPAKGFTFSTYATNWIRSAIQRGHASFEGHGYRYMTGYGSGKPRGTYRRPLDLDRPMSADGATTIGETLADESVDVETAAVSAARVQEIQAAILRACRDPLDLAVAESIIGGDTRNEIAARHDVTPEAVRQRKERLATRLRHPVYGLVARIPKAKEAAMTDLATMRVNPNGTGTYRCPECGETMPNAQGLGAHRRARHGVTGAYAGKSSPKGTRPKRPVLIELVDEDPPPPVIKAPKVSDLDRILQTIEAAEMPPGKWMRVAIFVSSRAARAMATRLRKRTEGGPWEWYAPGDDRLFVRMTPDE